MLTTCPTVYSGLLEAPVQWWSSSSGCNLMLIHAAHKHWHTGAVLVHLVGLLVNGFSVCLTIGCRSFSWVRKVPAPSFVPSKPFSVEFLKCFASCYKQVDQESTNGLWRGFNLIRFLLVLRILAGDSRLVWKGVILFFLPLRRLSLELIYSF